MTDIYERPTGGTAVLSPPEWVAEPPPWSPSWVPPTQPGYASGGGGFGPTGPNPGWQPPPPPPAAPEKNGGRSVAVILVAALISALIGVGIGRQLGRNSSTPVAVANTPATSPATTPAPATGGSAPSATTPSAPQPSNGAGAVPGNTSAIAAKVTPGLVDINTQLSYQNAAAAGTGMVLTASGEVLTNNHVIDGATTISVTIPSTGQTYSATVVGTDKTEDVAVLQLKGASGLKTIPLGDSSAVGVGDSVVALGNAGGVGGAPSVVTGTVQAVNQTITASDQGGANAETVNGLIETNAPIQPGDSGGPLANNNGQVIGMDTAASSARRFASGAAVAFAIPINHALSIAQQIESGKASNTITLGLPGFLGVGVSATASGNGAVLSGVASGTPAARAGLAAGDTITSVNGTPVSDGPGLTAALHGHHSGDKVTLTWTTQSGATRTATITLTAGPAD